MAKIDFIGRTLTAIVAIGFLIAGICDVLDFFIVKFLLVTIFIGIVMFVFFKLVQNENHPEI